MKNASKHTENRVHTTSYFDYRLKNLLALELLSAVRDPKEATLENSLDGVLLPAVQRLARVPARGDRPHQFDCAASLHESPS